MRRLRLIKILGAIIACLSNFPLDGVYKKLDFLYGEPCILYSSEPFKGNMTKLKAIYLGDLRTQCIHESGAIVETDAPRDNQGKGEYFSPTDLLAISLGSCMLTLMGIAARQLGLDLKGAHAEMEKEMSQHPPRRIGRIVVRIRSSLSPTPEEMKKMEQMAMQCPVHASLHPDIRLEIDFVWGL